ncbi:MAG: GMP synthase (glutamine-hydrolyzing), partial [Thermoprotei archaeon]
MKEDVKVGDIVLVIDFGGQYTHLIARRIRQLKVYSEIRPFTISIDEIVKLRPKGIILSGGPRSVYTDNSPKVDKRIFDLGIPILGICYGHQLIAYMLGGKV